MLAFSEIFAVTQYVFWDEEEFKCRGFQKWRQTVHLCSHKTVFSVVFFYFFPKNSKHSVLFWAITELRATWKFLTQFLGPILEFNHLSYPLKFRFFLTCFTLSWISYVVSWILQDLFAIYHSCLWIINSLSTTDFFLLCWLFCFHSVNEYVEQHWTWQKTFASCLLACRLSIFHALLGLFSLPQLGADGVEKGLWNIQGLTVVVLYFGLSFVWLGFFWSVIVF